jgi:Predicted transcriptional regulator with C-terminal CBS domains
MDIGQEIRKRRQELRLTQQSLADISGVSVRMIKSIEGNYANPSIRTVEKLLKSLNLCFEIMETRQAIDA